VKRVMRKFGASGERILRSEPWRDLKCFHAGGEAKWWLDQATGSGIPPADEMRTSPGAASPFIELEKEQYEREQAVKGMLRGMGYYRMFGGG
jgi:hypothetical protein